MAAPDRISASDYRRMMGVSPVTDDAAKSHAESKHGKPRSKFGNKRTEVDGEILDSKLEARRYAVLKAREAAGDISELQRQVPYALAIEGVLIATYKADFVWFDNTRKKTVVEDVKSKATITDVFKIKRRLMWALNRIEISIVERAEA